MPSLLDDLRHGWQEFRGRGWLWGLTLQWAVYALAVLGPVTVIGPVLAKQHLGGAAAWGLIATSLGLGLIGGTIAVRRLRLRRPALVVAVVVLVLPAEAAALAAGAPLGLVIAAATLTGVATGIVTVTTQATMQRNVPAAVLARVSAFDLVGSEVTLPLGYALAGVVAATSETRPVLLVGSGMLWMTTVAIIAIPAVRGLRSESPAPSKPAHTPSLAVPVRDPCDRHSLARTPGLCLDARSRRRLGTPSERSLLSSRRSAARLR